MSAEALVLNRPSARIQTEHSWFSHLRRSRAWKQYMHNRLAVVSAVALFGISAFVLLAPIILPFSAEEGNLLHSLENPSFTHPLGTDANGRDVLARIVYGGRISLSVGLFSVIISIALGSLVGALSGYYGGFVDAILMRCTEAMLALPTFFVVLAVLSVFQQIWAVPLVIGLTNWMNVARVVRGEFLRWNAVEFVEAAHVAGSSDARIIVRHILPQAVPAIIVSATLGIAHAVLTESAISYLGMGVQPPTPTWGNMLNGAQTYLWTNPLLAVFPGLMILFTVMCFNSIGDGLRDALDPRRGHR